MGISPFNALCEKLWFSTAMLREFARALVPKPVKRFRNTAIEKNITVRFFIFQKKIKRRHAMSNLILQRPL